jgi:hypothetical protein
MAKLPNERKGPPMRVKKRQAAQRSPRAGAKDRPGFDLGGAVGKETAGTGLGPGKDAFAGRRGRRLPGHKSLGKAGRSGRT